jgi:hypothetical protein
MKDSYIDGVAKRRIDQVRIGDLIDFQSDPLADPDRDDDAGELGNHPEFEFEFAAVESIELEPHDTDPCIVLHTTQGSYGFPPDHWIEVDGEQIRKEEAPIAIERDCADDSDSPK